MKIHRQLLCIAVLITTLTLGIAATMWFRILAECTVYVGKTVTAKLRETKDILISVQPSQGAESIEVAPASTNKDQTGREEALDYSGYYYLDSDQRPESFPDFQYIDVTTYEYNFGGTGEYVSRRIAPEGSVQASSRYEFAKIAIINSEITFQTETLNGVRYEFSGNFTNDLPKEYCTSESDQTLPALTGKLTKIKNGKRNAELDLNLAVTCGD